jgi:putative transcriptional regulator
MYLMDDNGTSLVGKLLIAMPTLMDPNFWRTVVLLGVHSADEGAFGLVINRPLGVAITDVLQELGEEDPGRKCPEVLGGGPVEPTHGFVLYERELGSELESLDEHALNISQALAVSGSTETLVGLAKGSLGGRFYLLLGYSGWAPGQLEREIEENAWLVAPLDSTIVFDVPHEDRWSAALHSIGVDPGALVDMGSTTPS